MQTNTNTKVKATPKSRSLQHQKQVQSDPKIKLKTNFKNKPTSKTHERTHEQTCCKLHKQTHEITVALMRKEMQNWPTNRIKNATKMHEETLLITCCSRFFVSCFHTPNWVGNYICNFSVPSSQSTFSSLPCSILVWFAFRPTFAFVNHGLVN